jgi:hypothetical protein
MAGYYRLNYERARRTTSRICPSGPLRYGSRRPERRRPHGTRSLFVIDDFFGRGQHRQWLEPGFRATIALCCGERRVRPELYHAPSPRPRPGHGDLHRLASFVSTDTVTIGLKARPRKVRYRPASFRST